MSTAHVSIEGLQRLRWLERHAKRRARPRPELGPRGLALAGNGWVGGAGGQMDAVASNGGPPRRVARDPLLALVHRITQGFQQEEYERARALGYDAYLEEQLEPFALDDSALDARLSGFATLGMSPKEIVVAYPEDATVPYLEIKGATLLRSLLSKRQLFERMCEFWSDHFNLDHNKSDFLYVFKPEDDRTVIRAHALGTFPELLSASAHGAAMLFYLDNWLNFAGAIQENYARELLELHTLGVGGGYTEEDVRQVARCLTGWTLNGDEASPDYLRARYEPAVHQGGAKVVLGVSIPASPGRENLTRVLEILSAHPSTARFLARKLIRWLLNETPTSELIEQVAATYLATSGDIKAMLRVILAEQNLAWTSPNQGARFRRPFHLMTSILRGLGADLASYEFPLYYLATMGHSPFDWAAPNGYPDTVQAWGNSLLPRWRFLQHLADGFVQGVELPLARLLDLLEIHGPNDHAGLARRINRRILGSALSVAEEDSVQQFVDSLAAPFTYAEALQAIAFAASLPGYQWY